MLPRPLASHLQHAARKHLPLSQGAPCDVPPLARKESGAPLPAAESRGVSLSESIFTEFYPRLHNQAPDLQGWLRSCYQTCFQRDLRSLVNIGDIEAFGLCSWRPWD